MRSIASVQRTLAVVFHHLIASGVPRRLRAIALIAGHVAASQHNERVVA
jgi:hypothetical protein